MRTLLLKEVISGAKKMMADGKVKRQEERRTQGGLEDLKEERWAVP